ncbi:PAS and ANTAR domain-containing protein [Streptomyces sp. NPDC006624]|uniref:PAS and ANTAR domain-containing protein n=1 Tax=unclassified Streptomyces TaxID=2593676 RepID=UPI00339E24DD
MRQRAGRRDATQDALTGVFVHRVPEDTWWWSDELYRLLGHAPDSVEPTSELFREHWHPDDRERVEKALASVRADGRPFGCYHRLTDTSGEEHAVVLVADGRTDDGGDVVTVRGFVVDVTEPLAAHARDLAEGDVARARVSQEDIDLARGILMARYGVDAEVAMRLLRRRSQDTNRKVRDLARELLAAAPAPAGEGRHDPARRIGAVLYSRETD